MKRTSRREWLIAVLCSLLLVDGVILLNVPFLRPLLAFTYFSTVPGFLLLNALKLNRVDAPKRFVLSVGLSIAFLLAVGLCVNFLGLAAGIATPMSTQSLVGGYSAALLALALLVYRRNADLGFDPASWLHRLKSVWNELVPFGVIALSFPPLTVIAVSIVNTLHTSVAMLCVLAGVSVYILLVWRFKSHLTTTTYIVAIWAIGLAMVISLPLRGIVVGGDFGAEFAAVLQIARSGFWTFSLSSPYYSSLSAAFLSAVYYFLLGTDPLRTYQFVDPILLCILPVTAFLIVERYASSFSAFLCALLLVFQVSFLEAGIVSVRSRIVLLFLVLLILVAFDNEIRGQKRQVLALTFLACMILTYYTFSYLFVFLMLCVVFISALSERNRPPSKRVKHKQIFGLSMLVLCAAAVYLWWGILAQGTVSSFWQVLSNSIRSLAQSANLEARTPVEQKVYATGLQGPGDVLRLFAYYATVLLAALGVAFAIFKSKETKFPDEYRFLMIACLVLWAVAAAMPGLGSFVPIEQVLVFTLVILLPCIPLGALTIVRAFALLRAALRRIEPTALRRHESPSSRASSRRLEPVQAIIVMVLILTLLGNTGVSYQLFGQPQAVLLNSQGQQYDMWYVHPQEIASVGWLSTRVQQDPYVFSDYYGLVRVGMGTLLQPSAQPFKWNSIWDWNLTESGYLYLRYENVVDHTAIVSKQRLTNASQIYTAVPTSFRGDKIYSNGGSDIYLWS